MDKPVLCYIRPNKTQTKPHLRARVVGLYYLVRSLSITPAAFIGGILWKFAPETPFVTAGVIGLIGTIVFALTVEERYAS